MNIKFTSIVCFTVFACTFLMTDCQKYQYEVLGADNGSKKIIEQIKYLKSQLTVKERSTL